MSTDSATSNRWSSLQSTTDAGSGVLVRPVQAVTGLGLVEGRVAARLVGRDAGGFEVGRQAVLCRPKGSAVVSPAISSPPSAVSSSARRVECGLAGRAATAAAGGAFGLVGRRIVRQWIRPTSRSIVTGVPACCENRCECAASMPSASASAEPRGPRPVGRESDESRVQRRDRPEVAAGRPGGRAPFAEQPRRGPGAGGRRCWRPMPPGAAAISAADTLRAEQKAVSKQVGWARAASERPAVLAQAKELAAQVKAAEAEQAEPSRRSARRTWPSPT